MSDTRVDLLLALRTTLQGNAEALAYLDKFESTGRHAASEIEREWENLQRKLERKFSFPDLAYDLMRSFGIGSAGAIVEKSFEAFFGGIDEKLKAAQEKMHKFQEEVNAAAEKLNQINERKIEKSIDQKSPEDRAAERQREIARLDEATKAARAAYDKAQAELANAGGGHTSGLFDKQGWVNDLKTLRSMFLSHPTFSAGEWQKWTDERVAAMKKAQRDLADFAAKRMDLEDKVEKDTKTGSDETHATLQAKLAAEEATFNATVEAQKKSTDQWEANAKAADAVLQKSNDLKADALEIAHINELRGKPGGLLDSEADAAIAAVKARREAVNLGRDDLELTNKLGAITAQIAAIEHDNLLSSQDKNAKILPLLQQQNKLIADRIKLLGDEAKLSTTTDPKLREALTRDIDRLQKELASGQGRVSEIQNPNTLANRASLGLQSAGLAPNAEGKTSVDETAHFASGGDGMLASLQQQLASIGTWGDRLNRAFTSVGESIRNGIGGALVDMATKGGSFASKMLAFSNVIAMAFIQAGAQMVADWIMQHTIMALVRSVFHAKDIAQTTAAAGAKITIETTATGTKVGIVAAGEAAKTGIVIGGAAARTAAVTTETAATTSVTAAGATAQASATGIAGVFRSIMELGPIAGPLVFAAAIAGMIALVGSLAHRESGGIVPGGHQLIHINENGTESVLNARATADLGSDFIDALNAGDYLNAAAAIAKPDTSVSPGASYPRGSGSNAVARRSESGRAGANGDMVVVDYRDRYGLEQVLRHPAFRTKVHSLVDERTRRRGVRTV